VASGLGSCCYYAEQEQGTDDDGYTNHCFLLCFESVAIMITVVTRVVVVVAIAISQPTVAIAVTVLPEMPWVEAM